MKQSQRSKRLGELIQRNIANSLLFYYRDNPILLQVTVTAVEVTPDLAIARVFISVLDENNIDLAIKELQQKSNNLRHLLAQDLNLRLTPQLQFVYDYSIAKGQKLSALIDAACKADEKTVLHDESE